MGNAVFKNLYFHKFKCDACAAAGRINPHLLRIFVLSAGITLIFLRPALITQE
jgi:hypothetical protein